MGRLGVRRVLIVKRVAAPLIAVAVVIVFGVVDAQKPEAPLAIEPSHFSHGDHMNYKTKAGKIVDTQDPKQCGACHTIDAKGGIKAPAAQGHAPCLQSKCHGDDPLSEDPGAPSFFAISEKNSKSPDPKMQAAFKKASAFCLACHEQVPWAWKKPTTRMVDAWVNQREHHIRMAKSATSTMDHWAHTQMKKKDGKTVVGCRDCHAVDTEYKPVKGAPGHTQCVQCHNAVDKMAFTMAECGKCHISGSRDEWLKEIAEKAYAAKGIQKDVKDVPARMKADVFTCNSQGAKQMEKKGRKVNCFKHETKQHRTDKAGEDVQCKKCHWIVFDKKSWGTLSFSNLADLHTNKIIGDPTSSDVNKQHAACGASGCHAPDVELATGKCQKCHAIRTSKEPYW